MRRWVPQQLGGPMTGKEVAAMLLSRFSDGVVVALAIAVVVAAFTAIW